MVGDAVLTPLARAQGLCIEDESKDIVTLIHGPGCSTQPTEKPDCFGGFGTCIVGCYFLVRPPSVS